ncbi:MAG: hypothetical protein MUC60_04375 [Oscillatoria sp. Prado101]|nr:hypothetical protein [Oscillatoria sp. Prado101]
MKSRASGGGDPVGRAAQLRTFSSQSLQNGVPSCLAGNERQGGRFEIVPPF